MSWIVYLYCHKHVLTDEIKVVARSVTYYVITIKSCVKSNNRVGKACLSLHLEEEVVPDDCRNVLQRTL
jgi:hypothetical protein